MSSEEYKKALGVLKWSQAKLARRLGVHVNTTTNWAQEGPPQYAAEYLRVILLAKQMLEGGDENS